MSARLHIDWQRCTGHGSCLELLPELLSPDDWGHPMGAGGSEVGVPPQLVPHARRAAAWCPKLALTVRQD